MLERWTPVIATAVLAFTPAVQAPSEPDFSGDWKLVSSPPSGADAALAMSVEQPVKRADVYGKPMKPFFSELLVTRDFANGSKTERHYIGAIGGRVGGVVPGGRQAGSSYRSRHSVVWEGRTLVMENSQYTGSESGTGEWDERREEWSFESDGRLRVVITSRSSQSPAASTVTVFYQRR
jgi:hypothetical protein